MSGAGFVKIAPIFLDKKDRTVTSLAQKYDNRQLLVGIIEDLFRGTLSSEKLRGKKVLIKPNWVRHSLKTTDEICLRTHNAFLLATLEVVLGMQPCSVIIGDAPLQGCIWEHMHSTEFIEQIARLGKKHGIQVLIKDFRRVTFRPAKNELTIERNPITDYVVFDLGKQSYLEPVSYGKANLFRVTDYNPDRLSESHGPGVHKYCIAKELFDVDVVISLPKVKTHQKTGITCALKNLVGLNGDKDFLPHHRLGGSGRGGDCYPGKNFLRYWAELAKDEANRHRGESAYRFWRKLSSLLWHLSFPGAVHQMAAAWHGNDTTWRMVLDLNQIAVYGQSDGKVSKVPQRELYSLCDGIVGGQGDGPLKPDPLPLGILCFSNDAYFTDLCLATLMGFDLRRIPMLAAVEKLIDVSSARILYNNEGITFEKLKELSVQTKPPPGWVDHFSKTSS